MRVINQFALILKIIIVKLLLLIPKTIVACVRIIANTGVFLIEQIEQEFILETNSNYEIRKRKEKRSEGT